MVSRATVSVKPEQPAGSTGSPLDYSDRRFVIERDPLITLVYRCDHPDAVRVGRVSPERIAEIQAEARQVDCGRCQAEAAAKARTVEERKADAVRFQELFG